MARVAGVLLLVALLPARGAAQIFASPKRDPGCRDLFGAFGGDLAARGDESMPNLKAFPNDGNAPGAQGVPLVQSRHEGYPAADHVVTIESAWRLDSHKRNFVLLVEDMEKGYEQYVHYVKPPVKKVLQKFRELGLPVGSSSRASAARRRLSKDENNPAYIFGEDGADTVEELAPITEEERSRVIQSLHLNKFADLDEEGREILFPMLQAWGVNTIVLTGAWTDDCIAATAFSAADEYGFDVVLITDGVATATVHGGKMIDVMCAAMAKCHTAGEVLEHIAARPDLVEAPKAPLRGDVYLSKPKISTRSLEL